jgi:hypothetical protein
MRFAAHFHNAQNQKHYLYRHACMQHLDSRHCSPAAAQVLLVRQNQHELEVSMHNPGCMPQATVYHMLQASPLQQLSQL